MSAVVVLAIGWAGGIGLAFALTLLDGRKHRQPVDPNDPRKREPR